MEMPYNLQHVQGVTLGRLGHPAPQVWIERERGVDQSQGSLVGQWLEVQL